MEDAEQIMRHYQKAAQNYKKAAKKCSIAFWLWILCIIVQILANLDKILPFLNSQ